MGARQQPLMCVITTAGVNTSFPCYAKQKQVQKVLSGELVNDELFGIIYTIDKDDDWTKIETWKKANPNYGVSVFEDFLKGQLKTALQDSRKQNIIKCKHLNIWSNAGDAWLNMASWQNCTDLEMSLSDFEGGIRTPMIAWLPGKVQAGTKTNQITAFWDILPTLSELTKTKLPVKTDGIS